LSVSNYTRTNIAVKTLLTNTVTETNEITASWPLGTVAPSYHFTPWPFWLLLVLVILFLIYSETRRRLAFQPRRAPAQATDDDDDD